MTLPTPGNHGNQIIWRYGTGLKPSTPSQVAAVTLNSFVTMDLWLSNLYKTSPKPTLNSVRTQAEVIDAKPATAFDVCYLTGDTTFSTPVTHQAACDADPRLAKHSSPRQVAGGPLQEDILQCQLKAVDPADFAPAVLDASQLTRLNVVFPDGVCDWTKPGVGQQEAVSPLTFAAGPGGEPLPPAPVPVSPAG